MNNLNSKQLKKLQKQLLLDKQDIQQRIQVSEHHGLGDSLRDSVGELSPIDNHPADLGTEMFERGKDLALQEQADLQLARIDAALRAMEEETYGKCLTCQQFIPFERLNAMPTALYCVEHAPRQAEPNNRPAEEDYLNPPFGRSSMDEQSGYNGFDGEDAWQIVQQWGNSDSPAMSEQQSSDYDNLMIEADEAEGYVEPLESFLATDITGSHVVVYRNRQYRKYMESEEGDRELEWDVEEER